MSKVCLFFPFSIFFMHDQIFFFNEIHKIYAFFIQIFFFICKHTIYMLIFYFSIFSIFFPSSSQYFFFITISVVVIDDKGNAKTRIRQRKKNRRLLMLILMVMVFAICWLPLHLFHILIDIGLIDYNYRIFMMVSALPTYFFCFIFLLNLF